MNRPLRILCADDNTMLGDVMLCLFAQLGHWVEYAEDGLRAWERLIDQCGRFDVLVTDHQMPGLNGLRLVERARAEGLNVRVVVHSSGLEPATAEAYRCAGVDAFVPKGTRAETLIEAVRCDR